MVRLMLELTVTRYQSFITPFLRLLAHFDALDGDDDTDSVQPRYELLYPEDSMPDFGAAFLARLDREFILGSPV